MFFQTFDSYFCEIILKQYLVKLSLKWIVHPKMKIMSLLTAYQSTRMHRDILQNGARVMQSTMLTKVFSGFFFHKENIYNHVLTTF